MTSSRRRLAALMIAPLIVVGLAACAGVEPDAMPSPTPTPTPTPTETVAAPTMPTSRVPATCEELFASSLVSDGVASAYASPPAQQAGYLGCVYEGTFGGTSGTMAIEVSVDPPIDELNRVLGWSDSPGGSFSCDELASYCSATFGSGTYEFRLYLELSASGGAVSTVFEGIKADIEQRVASWPNPAPLWQPPADVLRWEFDCALLIPRQDVVRNAVPFPVGDASRRGGDPSAMHLWAMAATGSTACAWDDVNAAGITVEILPGGAWMHEAGILLEGEPYPLEGALAAVSDTGYGDSRVSAYIDGSLVTVGVRPPEGSGIDGYAVADDVIAALVAAF